MNLREFLNHRTNCLCCDEQLNISFDSSRRQNSKIDGDNFIVTFILRSIKKWQNEYKISYIINMDTGKFNIEFYQKNGDQIYHNHVPLHIIDRLKELNRNFPMFKFVKYCRCGNHIYTSNLFNIDYKKSVIDELLIAAENISVDLNNTSYYIRNYYSIKQTHFSAIKYEKKSDLFFNFKPEHIIKIDLIQITDLNSLINRIDKLMVFS